MREELSQLLRRHLEAENAHDMDATLGTLTSDCRFDDVALGSYRGHDGASQYYRLWWDAFDTEVSPEGLHDTGGPFVVAETRWRGRHVGPFLGVEASGRSIDVPVAIVVEVRDGLMAAEKLYWDARSLLGQIQAP
jgi:steroid delta-isomerase-like uncharacterized protein